MLIIFRLVVSGLGAFDLGIIGLLIVSLFDVGIVDVGIVVFGFLVLGFLFLGIFVVEFIVVGLVVVRLGVFEVVVLALVVKPAREAGPGDHITDELPLVVIVLVMHVAAIISFKFAYDLPKADIPRMSKSCFAEICRLAYGATFPD